ncbi:MAG: dTMP kinase [Planctomycetota bacterium]
MSTPMHTPGHAGGAGQPHAPDPDRASECASARLPDPLAAALRGRMLVFEGPDGSGKSTQFARFARAAREAGLAVCEVREPGGTGIGEAVRDLLLAHTHGDMTLRCEMLLYMASRAQLVEQTVRPALDRGELVLADRFVSSTLAYQGAGGGLPEAEILAVADAATGGLTPDLVLVFDVDEATAAARRDAKPDRIESRPAEFRERVRQSYLEQARRDPDRYAVLDATCAAEGVYDRLLAALADRFASAARATGS